MNVVLKYLPTEENTADLLTKALGATQFDRLMLKNVFKAVGAQASFPCQSQTPTAALGKNRYPLASSLLHGNSSLYFPGKMAVALRPAFFFMGKPGESSRGGLRTFPCIRGKS